MILSSIGISERSQGLFALARLAAPTYCHWRYCVRFSRYLESAAQMRAKYNLGMIYLLTDDPAISRAVEAGQYANSGFRITLQSMDRSRYDGPGKYQFTYWHIVNNEGGYSSLPEGGYSSARKSVGRRILSARRILLAWLGGYY